MSDRMQAKAAAPTVSSASVSRAVRPSITPVRSALLQRACACGQLPGSGGKCEDCDKKEKGKDKALQRASNGGAQPATVPAVVNQALSSPGRPLDTSTRTFMESRFGHDFGAVRVHDDSLAAESARAVNARAYTVGNDIVFDHGRYNPADESGKHLLAHELAHTIQQGGVHRYANDLRLGGSMESHLEREADSAAHAVLAPASPAGLSPVPVASRAAGPIISRATDPASQSPPPAAAKAPPAPVEGSSRDWEEVKDPKLALIASHQSRLQEGETTTEIRAYRIREALPLPSEKGPVLALWQARAKAGALESIIGFDGNPRPVLKQESPSSEQKRAIWLGKVGWATKTQAAKNWAALGGDTLATFEPMIKGRNCDMDHVIELQIGGNNIVENLQPLDLEQNRKSGQTVFTYLRAKATEIRAISGVKNIILHFDDVVQGGSACNVCCEMEQKATGKKGPTPDDVVVAQDDSEPYEVTAGVKTEMRLPKGTLANRKKTAKIPISDSDHPKTKAASTLIPGMILKTLILPPTGSDTVKAYMDTENSKTKLPLTVNKEKGEVDLTVTEARELKLSEKSKHPKIAFIYPYLSSGTITKLDYDPKVGLSGEGQLTPSIPILNKMKLGVRFSPTEFEIVAGLDPAKMGKPFPGLTITKAELALKLFPFEPSGSLDFELAPGGKKILDAQLKIKPSPAGGFLAIGNLNAYIPGVDKTDGTVKYEDGKWSGFAKAETSQIKLPYVKDATIEAGFNEKGPFGQGTVNLEIPGGHIAAVSLTYRNQKWYFSGKGVFKIPKPIDADLTLVISYFDGEKLKGDGTLKGFKFKDLSGDLAVHYDGKVGAPKPRIWGEGNLKFKKPADKPKVVADLSIKLLESGRFSGEGHISYEIKPNLVAEAGIKIDEHGKVTVSGQLKFPPYELFKKFPDPAKRITIFEMPTISIPIPGASIGPIGLQARIDAGIYADYSVGPGEIRGGYVKSSINPFEENVDLDVEVGGQVYIPASFSVTGSVSGSVALDVKIASVSGGLTVSVTASLNGHVLSNLKAHYFKGKFEASADFELMLALALYLALKAFVKAEAGVWRFKVSTTKEWKLAEFKFDTGLKMGLKLKKPVAYSSETGFTAPSLDDIEWILPKFEPEKAVKESFSRDKGVANPPEPPPE